jgi:bifunctional UDP-N-acetylglucosamine pyrophosphorylase/glucosamine-1-phosphate N-acetyltransferase
VLPAFRYFCFLPSALSFTAIILAAGKSTRMKSRRPKVLHEVCGRPMLDYILDACYDAGVDRVLLVVGFEKEQVIAHYSDEPRITFVEQAERLGTGHAARMCEPELKKQGAGDVLILVGDVPLVRAEVLKTLRNAHRQEHAAASMATAVVSDPTGYGRIVRDQDGNFLDIVEEADCTPEQRQINEVFPSFYCVKSTELLGALAQVKNENRQREYYLTDIFGILRREGKKVLAVQAATEEDVIAPNSRQQLAEADAILQDRIQRSLRDSGVTITNGDATYIECGSSIGQDTCIYPFTFIGGGSSIGRDCTIGPFACVPRGSIVTEGSTVAGNVTPETAMLEIGNRKSSIGS